MNAVAPGQLVHSVDQLTGRRFFIDTGASYSIFPHRSMSPPSSPTLPSVNGQRIPCWGKRPVQLNFHGRRFEWTFLLADVTFAIIGVDFLCSHKSSLGRYVFGSEISYNKAPPRLPVLAYLIAQSRKKSWDIEFQKILDYEFQKIVGH